MQGTLGVISGLVGGIRVIQGLYSLGGISGYLSIYRDYVRYAFWGSLHFPLQLGLQVSHRHEPPKASQNLDKASKP